MNRKRWPVLLAVAALVISVAGHTSAGDLYNKSAAPTKETPLPEAADIKALSVFPTGVTLKGADDAQHLVKEGRGRRLFPAAPDRSLLLLKAAGGMAHGGGKRTEAGSDEYRLIRRWIASGSPYGKPTDPKVTKISVLPEHRVMTRHNK